MVDSTTITEGNKFPAKLLLHCESGLPPYLTPYFLSQHFPPDSSAVRNHLILGIEMRDSCVFPVYTPRPSKTSKDRKRRREKTKECPSNRAADGNDSDMDPPKEGHGSKESIKPTGYTFAGRPISKYLCVPLGYETMVCPTFDLLDGSKEKGAAAATSSDVALSTANGCQKLTPSLFCDVVQGLEATNCVTLYDQAEGPGKRNKKSVERTISWLKRITENPAGSERTRWWAPVVGGEDRLSRGLCLVQILEQKNIHGLALVGLHHTESRELRKEIITSIVAKSPTTMPKALLVANDLYQILDAVQCGIQVIGTSLPTLLARQSMALSLELYGWGEQPVEKGGSDRMAEEEASETKINRTKLAIDETHALNGRMGKVDATLGRINGCIRLDDDVFVRDQQPLLKGCTCVACINHKRSYVHHLIKANELLAEILLFNHNLHHLLKLFEQISYAGEMNQLGELQSYIESQI